MSSKAGDLAARWTVTKLRVSIMNVSGANVSKSGGLTASTHRLGGGGSASLQIKKAFSTNPGLTDARTRHETLKARKLELETAKLEGRLIDREVVTATGVHIIATARTALLSLGYRIAEKVAGKSDISEIARIVENEVRDVLGVLADEAAFFAALEAEALS